MTGGVSGDDRGFEGKMGDGEWFFRGFGRGVSSVFGADFQGVKEKNCYLGREKNSLLWKKMGPALTMTPMTAGGIYFCRT